MNATPIQQPVRINLNLTNTELDTDEIRRARIDLAACFRAAANAGFAEGVCNHFSAVVPGHDDYFLVNPYGMAFAEITASDLLICDYDGNVIDGSGTPEETAFYIHSRLHKHLPRARVAFHTHMPYATALCALQGRPLRWIGQNSLRFYGRTIVDEHYNGLALDNTEGDRIAASIGDAEIVFMKNHGVMIIARTIEEAWDDLYYLERACQVQVMAESTGRKLQEVSDDLARQTCDQFLGCRQPAARTHLDSVKRILNKQCPEFRS